MGDMWGIGATAEGISSGLSAHFQNVRAEKEAKKAREWSQWMRATAYQATTESMRQAGLNPILAATGGGGAHATATPMGPVAPVVGPKFNFGDAIGRSLTGAKQMRKMSDEVAILKAQRRTAEADATVAERGVESRVEGLRAAVSANYAQQTLAEDQALQARSNRGLIDVRRQLEGSLVPAARAEMELDQTEFGEKVRQFHRVMNALPVFGGSIGRGRIRSR